MKNTSKMQARMAPEGGRAIVALSGEIGCWGFSAESWDAVESWCQENAVDKMTLRINSPGGHLLDAFAIIDKISASSMEIEAEIFGLCASAATIIALSCKKVRMSAHSQFMVHHPFGVISGTLEEMQQGLDRFATMRDQAFKMYAAKTGKDAETILSDHATGIWYTAEQALEYGFIDEIIGADTDTDSTDEPEEPKTEPGGDDVIDRVSDMYSRRGLLDSAAVAAVANFFGMRTPAQKAEDNRLAALTEKVATLESEMSALRAERDGAQAAAAMAEAEAAEMEKRIADRVAAAIARDRAALAINPDSLPAPADCLKAKNEELAGLTTAQLISRAAAEAAAH